jgi:ferredoxin
MAVRVTVDHALCQGHGACYFASDELFAIREGDGRAVVLADPVPDGLIAAARRAEANCPERAIILTEG